MESAEDLFERIGEEGEELLWFGGPNKYAKIKLDLMMTVVAGIICIPFVLLSLYFETILLQIIFFIPVLFIAGVIFRVLLVDFFDFEKYLYLVTNHRIIVRGWLSGFDIISIQQINHVVIVKPIDKYTDIDFCTGYKLGNTDKIINKKRLESFDHLTHAEAKQVKSIVTGLIRNQD